MDTDRRMVESDLHSTSPSELELAQNKMAIRRSSSMSQYEPISEAEDEEQQHGESSAEPCSEEKDVGGCIRCRHVDNAASYKSLPDRVDCVDCCRNQNNLRLTVLFVRQLRILCD